MQIEIAGGPVPGFWDILKHGRLTYGEVAPLVNRTNHAFRNWRIRGFISQQGREDIKSVLGLSDEELDNPMDRETSLRHAERWRILMRDPRTAWTSNRMVWTVGLVQVYRASNSTVSMMSELTDLAHETMRKYCRGVRLRLNLQSNMEPICRQLGISLEQMDRGLEADELENIVKRIGPRIEAIRSSQPRAGHWSQPYHAHLAKAVQDLRARGRIAVATEIRANCNLSLAPAIDRSKWKWRDCQTCLRRYQVGSTTTCADCIWERF